MRRALPLVLVALSPLAACGPIPVDQAERACAEDARLAEHPRGRAVFGIGSDGQAIAGLDVSISSDFLLGRDPSQVYDACVKSRSGQFPTRSFSDVKRG